MADPLEPLRGLAAASPPPEPEAGLRGRIRRRVRRRRAATGSLAAILLGVGTLVVTTRDDPNVVDTVDDTTTTTAVDSLCAGKAVISADVDGDGMEDQVFHAWDADRAEAVVGVCTAAGVDASMPGLGQAEVLQVIDVEPDGTEEVLFGATTVSSAAMNVAVLVGEDLVAVTVAGRELMTVEEGLVDQQIEGTRVWAAFGCEDLRGDGDRELVKVRVEFTDVESIWTKVAYDLDGSTARVAGTDEGTAPLQVAQFEYAASLTEPCTRETDPFEPPSEWPTEDVFAGVTLAGDVVIANAATGEPLVTVLPSEPGRNAVSVAFAPDRSVIYVGTLSEYSGGDLWRIALGEAPVVIGTADAVSVSPDGGLLATLGADPENPSRVLVLDALDGGERADVSIGELTGRGDYSARSVEWLPDGRLLVEAGLPESGSEIFLVDPDAPTAVRVGPPAGVPAGTGWSVGGSLDGGRSLLIAETCCSLDANSYIGPSSLLTLGSATLDEETRVPLEIAHVRLDIGPDGRVLILDSCCGSPDTRLLSLSSTGTVTPIGGPVYVSIDW